MKAKKDEAKSDKKKKKKKAAAKDDDDDDDDDDSEESEESGTPKSKAKATGKAKAKPKPKPKPMTTIVKWSPKKAHWPKMKLDGVVHWGGGSISHSSSKSAFRCHVRLGVSKSEKAFGYGVDGGRKEQLNAWALACKAIASDKRPRL